MLDEKVRSILPNDRDRVYSFCSKLSIWADSPSKYRAMDKEYPNTLGGFYENMSDSGYEMIYKDFDIQIFVSYEELGDDKLLMFWSYNLTEKRTYHYNFTEGGGSTVQEHVFEFIQKVLLGLTNNGCVSIDGKPLECDEEELKILSINIARWLSAPTLYRRINSNFLPIVERFRDCCLYNNFTRVLYSPKVEAFISYDLMGDNMCELKFRWINIREDGRGLPYEYNIGPFPIADFKQNVLTFIHTLTEASKLCTTI